jgi:plasmid replication initiation protein
MRRSTAARSCHSKAGPWPSKRFAVKNPRWEPCAGIPLARMYAVTMYERGCLLSGRREPRWKGSVEELREVMGVPTGKYRDWADIRRKVVEPACAEVNQIADFVASYRVESGPRNKVTAIELLFLPKHDSALAAAIREREASRIGRKARRKGTVETTVSALDLPKPGRGD